MKPPPLFAAVTAPDALLRLSRIILHLLLPLALFLAWEHLTRAGYVDKIFLPRPREVFSALCGMYAKGELIPDIQVSVVNGLRGFLVGAAIGLLGGFACGLSRVVEDIFGPLLNAIRQVPPLAWLPLIILWIGAGDLAKTIIIAKSVFFPVFLNTLQGMRGVSREYIEVGRIFDYGRLRLLRHIVIPAALPSIFVGLRFGAGISWALLIIAEMLGARRGLGFILVRSQELMHSDQLLVVIFIIGLFGFAIDVSLRRLEASLLRWKRGFEG
jgi:sulfonate transport system permease protein